MAQKSRFEAIITLAKAQPVNYMEIVGKPRPYKRSVITAKEGPSTFSITIKAGDAAALRASINAMMRQIQVIEGVTGKDFHKSAGRDRTKNI